MPHWEAILFDFDGVLIDSEPVHFACWAEVLAPLGVPLDWETYARHCIGVSDRNMLHLLGSRAEPPVDGARLWEEYPAKQQLFRERMAASPAVPGDLPDFVRSLAGRFKLAVVTSSGRGEVEPLLAASGMLPSFETLVCAADVTRHKPAPEPYLLAAERLGVRTALVAEDSDAGEESARAAGFDVVRIPDPRRTAALVAAKINAGRGPEGIE